MKKRNLSLFLAFAICIMQLVIPTTVYAAGNPSVTAANVSGAPGDEIQVDFTLSDNPGLTALLVRVGYDSSILELKDIKDYGFFGRTFSKPKLTNNPIRLNWVDGIDNYSENGKLATMIFKIKESAAEGQTSLTLTTIEGETFNYDNDNDIVTKYGINLSGGTITVRKSENTDTVVKPVIQNTTSDGFVIKAQAGYEYYVSESNSIPNGAVWTTDTTVTGKTPNTTYYVFGRIAATNTVEASAPSASTSVRIPNNDASLKSVNVAAGTISPAFAPTTYDYTVTVPYGGSISNAVVVPNDANASYKFTKTASDFGANNITEITVTAENGEDTKVYTVTYSEINSVLSSLKVNGTSVEGFDPDKTSYDITVSYADWAAAPDKTYTIDAAASKEDSNVDIGEKTVVLTGDPDKETVKSVKVTVTSAENNKTDYTINFTVLACVHDYKLDTVESVSAECEKEGKNVYVCSVCGGKRDETVNPLGHDENSEWVSLPAGCESEGARTKICSRCGKQIGHEVLQPTGHNWSAWTNTAGTDDYTRTCSNCNETQTRVVLSEEDHTHDFASASCQTEVLKEATCTEKGSRRIWCADTSCAGHIEEDIAMTAHTEETAAVDATCTEAGSKTVKCTVCGTTISETVIDPLGHSFADAWSTDSSDHWHSCTRCGAENAREAHTENEGTVSNYTKIYSCSVCGYEMRTEYVSATGTGTVGIIDNYNSSEYVNRTVTPFGGIPVKNNAQVSVKNQATGKTLNLKVQRNGNDVTLNLGSENDGYYANIFTTNDEFICSALIENGKVQFSTAEEKFNVVIDSFAYGEDISSAAVADAEADILSDNIMLCLTSVILLAGFAAMTVYIRKRTNK